MFVYLKNKRIADEKIRQALSIAMEDERKQLDEMVKASEPHVFSDRFNRRMEDVFQVLDKNLKKQRRKRRLLKISGIIAIVVLIIAVAFIV